MHIGERIKSKRIAKGLTQGELAQQVGYTDRSTIARIEAGRIDLPQSRVEKFAQILDVSPAYLMGLVSEETNAQNELLAKIIIKMRKDPKFLEAVSDLSDLSDADFENIRGLLSALRKK